MTIKILFFIPGSAIQNWSTPAALIAESFIKKGHEVLYVTCGGEYNPFCMTQAAAGAGFFASKYDKKRICDSCADHKSIYKKELALNIIDIDSYLTPSDRDFADKFATQSEVNKYKDIEFSKISVGRISIYEFLIQTRKIDLHFSDDETQFYKTILKNSVKTVIAVEKIVEQFKPDICIAEHTAYSYNKACQKVTEKNNIPSYFINSNTYNIAHSFELQILAQGDPFTLNKNTLAMWERTKNITCNKDQLKYVTNHFLSLFVAKGHAYSAPMQTKMGVRDYFKIAPNKKILLATMSSYDEMFAIDTVGNLDLSMKSDIFPTQTQWIKSLVDYIKNKQDLVLIIRIHPREFFKDQTGKVSQHAQHLKSVFSDLPSNVKINWPDQNISLYSFLEETDVCLNAWSTAGQEMILFGIPTVVYCGHALLYPESLNFSAKSKDEYFDMIQQALNKNISFNEIRLAFRWYVTLHLRIAENISDSYAFNTLKKKSFLKKLFLYPFKKIDRNFELKRLIRSRAKNLKASDAYLNLIQKKQATLIEQHIQNESQLSLAEETKGIKDQLSVLYAFLYGKSLPQKMTGLQHRLWSYIKN